MIITRRKTLIGLASLIAAPAIVRASSLMPVRALRIQDVVYDSVRWQQMPAPLGTIKFDLDEISTANISSFFLGEVTEDQFAAACNVTIFG